MADPANNGAQANATPSLNALAQYCKDFSFENPNAPRSLQPQNQGPQINLQVNVNAKQLADADFEVDLTLQGDAKTGSDVQAPGAHVGLGERSHEVGRVLSRHPSSMTPILPEFAARSRRITPRRIARPRRRG